MSSKRGEFNTVSRVQPRVKLTIRLPLGLSATISLEHLGSRGFISRFRSLHDEPSSVARFQISGLQLGPHGLRGLILPDSPGCCPTSTRFTTTAPPFPLLTLHLLTLCPSVPPSSRAFTRTLRPIWSPGTGVLSSLPFHPSDHCPVNSPHSPIRASYVFHGRCG